MTLHVPFSTRPVLATPPRDSELRAILFTAEQAHKTACGPARYDLANIITLAKQAIARHG